MKEKLKELKAFRDFAEKRGLELIMAIGTKWTLYTTADRFEIGENGVSMTFGENTRHDCPDNESIALSIEELEMSDADWSIKIEQVKAETKRKKEQAEQNHRDQALAAKRKKLEELKEELGEQ